MARHFFASLTRNGISLAGTALAAASLTLMAALIVIEYIGVGHGGAYLGILTFLILPALFVIGLLLIPVGIMRQHRKEKAGEGSRLQAYPALDAGVGE